MIRIVDVSCAQGSIDWYAVKQSGVAGVYVKCQNGNEGPDPMFWTHAGAAEAAGLTVGPYMFAFPLPSRQNGDGRTAREQAQRAWMAAGGSSGIGARTGDMPPALDLEWPSPEQWRKWGCSPAQLLAWGLEYLTEMERLSKRRPVLYTYPWWWSAATAAVGGVVPFGDFAQYPLWLADYAQAAGRVPAPGEHPRALVPWGSQWTLWQHDGNGGLRIPNGPDVDFSVFNGDLDAFADFVGMG